MVGEINTWSVIQCSSCAAVAAAVVVAAGDVKRQQGVPGSPLTSEPHQLQRRRHPETFDIWGKKIL